MRSEMMEMLKPTSKEEEKHLSELILAMAIHDQATKDLEKWVKLDSFFGTGFWLTIGLYCGLSVFDNLPKVNGWYWLIVPIISIIISTTKNYMERKRDMHKFNELTITVSYAAKRALNLNNKILELSEKLLATEDDK